MLFSRLGRCNFTLPDLVATLSKAIVDEPPAVLRDGGIVRDGYDAALDELRAASREGKDWIAGLQEREIARTGIKSLKVRFHICLRLFHRDHPGESLLGAPDYVRKQTTVNGERFITPELKEFEGKILGSDERAKAREIEIFQELAQHGVRRNCCYSGNGRRHCDARCACLPRRNRPRQSITAVRKLTTLGVIEISEGRHPSWIGRSGGERFVPNDTALDSSERRFAIITGPNMAGKSTYIRQVALLTLMSQIGSYVPAASRANRSRRIGSSPGSERSDDLSKGQSTFMVEMNETANILNNATAASLVILDEIGRGTSTFDGLEHCLECCRAPPRRRYGCRTLFATHYHEITDLERTRSGVDKSQRGRA